MTPTQLIYYGRGGKLILINRVEAMGVSTKKGDSGYTGLLGGERVPKSHLRIESGGTVDETNSLLGLARATSGDRRIKRIILQIQKHLFIIGAEISSPSMTAGTLKKAISASAF